MTTTQPTATTIEATQWLQAFAAALARNDTDATAALFHEDSYWRDLVAFTWNITTLEGRDRICHMLESRNTDTAATDWQLEGDPTHTSDGVIDAWLTFTTAVGRGKGRLRLRDGKAWQLFTALQELTGHEEKQGFTRDMGVDHGAHKNRVTWLQRRQEEQAALGYTEQPYVLIIGGGQGGIGLAARLRRLNIPTIVAERNPNAGDSWRNRYDSLTLHDPVWFDHMPYIPFPAHWPVFTPKDQMGDWLEMYVKVMGLTYWTCSEAFSAQFDDAEKRWTVNVLRNGVESTLHPVHLVFATGAYGPPKWLDLPGASDFQGEILHSSQYSDGARFKNKKVAVIGAASSGHDVSVDLWEAGAEVTMIQRNPTTVVRSDTLMDLAFDIYSEQATADGIDVDKADLIAAATPFALQPQAQRALYERIRARDADFYQRLQATGFLLDFGDDDTGLMMKAYRTGSGYYVDVGASDLIINGDIKVKAGVAIDTLTPTGIRFADGTEIAADAIVQSTGFQSMHEVVAQLVDRRTADAVGPCWGLGSGHRNDPLPWHGELRNMYKPTAQENLWFQGGNLALSRFFSKFLALQLKARYENLPTPIYAPPLT